MRRRWGRELISSEKRHQGKGGGAEAEGKIKSGVEAGELGPPASGCYYTSVMRNREAVVVVVAGWWWWGGACLCTLAHFRLNMHNSHAKRTWNG